jgi:hypothetical protein
MIVFPEGTITEAEGKQMKWTRKTKEFDYADYISEDGRFRVRDMSLNDRTGWWQEYGKRGYWWGLIEVTPNGENIIAGNFKTAKAAKEFAETI